MDSKTIEKRKLNFSHAEAHYAVAIMRNYVGWRKGFPHWSKWGVRKKRKAIVQAEVTRMIDAIRAVP